MRFLAKALLRGLIILLALPLLLGLLLASEPINRWLFEQVDSRLPQLSLEFDQGNLWLGWSFAQLRWQDESVDLDIERVSLAWSPSCLFGATLCLDSLSAERVTVITQPTEPQKETAPLSLPALQLPLALEVGKLHLGELSLDGETALLTDLELAAFGRGDELVIQTFSGSRPDLHWRLDGKVQMQGDWPLELTADVSLPPVDERDWRLHLTAGGDLRDLQLRADSRGYLTGWLDASANLFEPGFPLQLQWQGEDFLPLRSLPSSLTLQGLALDLAGDLNSGYMLHADAQLPGEDGQVALLLTAQANMSGVDQLALTLQVADDPARQLVASGSASWQGEPEAELQLAVDHFPWQSLYPVDTGEVVLQQLAATASLKGGKVDARLDAQLTGVAAQEVAVSARVQGDQQALDISPLSLTAQGGSATGTLQLELQPAVRWQGQFQLDSVDPSVFIAALPGSLGGMLNSSGALQGEQLTLDADWNLQGELRDQPLAFVGALNKSEETWALSGLRLEQGNNRVTGQGRWGAQVAAQLDLQLNEMKALWPGLRGALNGNLQLAGSAAAPHISAALQGARVGYLDARTSTLTLQLDTTLSKTLPMSLQLSAERLRTGATQLGNVQLGVDGDRASHRARLTLLGGDAEAELSVNGALSDANWQGELSQGVLRHQHLELRQDDAADVNYQLATGRLQLGEHCWRQADASLCFNGQQTLMPDRQLDVALNNFNLAELAPWMPADFDWQGNLQGQLVFNQKAAQAPVANVNLSSADGVITVKDNGESLTFPYQQLQFSTDLQARNATAVLELRSDVIGRLLVNANVREPAGSQRLSGSYQVEQLQLDFLRPFLADVEELQATLNGSGELSGVLREPVVTGLLTLRNGLITGPNLPVSFEQLQADIAIDGQAANIDGQWRSGEKGEGRVRGRVGWAPLDVALTLQGHDLPVNVEPYAKLLVAPNVEMSLRDGNLHVGGELAIPEGDIVVRELPAGAVRVSPDTVIVGRENTDTAEALGITARVKLNIGDQLRLNAFGLKGRLKGQLEVQENLNANGDLQILDGEFRRLGQDLKLRRALLLFSGPISQPYLNVEAIREVDDVIAGLRVTGNASAPTTSVFSEPGMSQQEAMSYLVLGRPLGEEGDSNLLGQAALGLGLAGAAPITRHIGDALGLEDFAVEAEGQGTDTQVVASGSITDKLSVRYGVGVFEPSNNLALRYELSRRLYLEAVSGFASSLDFFYRIDF
ncbi:translocation/assembly module TamB domain-containing protein [Halopseudomonas sp.]|uniref:translocation/assembly module TamB domain-containing protein n=1 Tax=Halopseudomonas sp. TaxID=2901191 RepID=UPI00311D4943